MKNFKVLRERGGNVRERQKGRLREGQAFAQGETQRGFIVVMFPADAGEVGVMRPCERVRDVMRQLPQGVIVAFVPAGTGLEPADTTINKGFGVGVCMPAEEFVTEGAFQIAERSAIGLDGAVKERQFITTGGETVFTGNQGLRQEKVTAFLHNGIPRFYRIAAGEWRRVRVTL